MAGVQRLEAAARKAARKRRDEKWLDLQALQAAITYEKVQDARCAWLSDCAAVYARAAAPAEAKLLLQELRRVWQAPGDLQRS